MKIFRLNKLVLLALFIASIQCMSQSFLVSDADMLTLQQAAEQGEFIDRATFKSVLQDVITSTMNAHQWSSENFSGAFTEIILSNFFGKENEIPSAELLEYLKNNEQISAIYTKYFWEIVDFLAQELQQDSKDLAENFELYNLTYDTFFIFQYQFPQNAN